MSSDAPDAAAYYYQYKSTVYDNLFVGIVYGEGLRYRDLPLLLQFLSRHALVTGVYIVLYATSVHILL